MSEDTAALTVTLKAGGGYDVPWIVVRGENPDEVVNKLTGLDGVIAAAVDAANQFKAAAAVAPIVQGGSVAAATVPVESQGPPPPWGQTPAAQQQGAAAPAQQNVPPQRSKFAGQPHPEGKSCEICPNILERKESSGGKAKWQCPDWRWNNGNPNGHTVEWIN